MADLDLRKLRYFVAVASELHFGRAAVALHIAQPVLSRQIRALEDELRVSLFVRSKRGTELTAAGEQLLADAPGLLAEAEAVRRRVTRAARAAGTFTVGFMPGLIVTAPVRAFGAAHPDLAVAVLRTGWDDQAAMILDGRVDVGYLRLPVDQRGLDVLPLFTEPRLVVLTSRHRLAAKEELHVADLADEHLLQDPDAVPEWRDIAVELRGRPTALPALRSVEEKLEHVAGGAGVVILPASVATFYRRPDVVAVPVADLAENQVCLAWRAGHRRGLLAEFVALAEAEHLG